MFRRLTVAYVIAAASPIFALAAATPAHASTNYGDCGITYRCNIDYYSFVTGQVIGTVLVTCNDTVISNGDTISKDGWFAAIREVACP